MTNSRMMSSVVDLFSEPTSYTDAVLLVEGRKMHVNKANLSYYSDFFNTLFNSDFAEKSMPEIPIKDVEFEHFAFILGMIHREKPTFLLFVYHYNTEKLLELADRFMMPHVTHLVETYLLTNVFLTSSIFLADKYRLEKLLKANINHLDNQTDIEKVVMSPEYKTLRDETKVRVYEKSMILKDIAPGVGKKSSKRARNE